MRYKLNSNELFVKNRKKLFLKLKKNSVTVLFSNDEMPRNGDQTYNFRQNSDLFYLTGISQPETILLICPDQEDENEREILFILPADPDAEIWNGHRLTKKEASEISGITNIKMISDFNFVFKNNAFVSKNIYMNLNEYPKFFTSVDDMSRRRISEIQKTYPLHKYKRLAPILHDLRLIKEPEEIELIKKSCKLTRNAFLRVLAFVTPGIYEYEAEAELTHEFIRNGAEGHSYQPIIASGKHSCVLHYVNNDKKCAEGDLLLMDFGAELAGYAADTTRTIPVSGKFSERQKEVYRAVLRVMRKAVELYKPGNTIKMINESVEQWIYEELINLKLIDAKERTPEEIKESRMKYFMHGTAHFLGLDVHDTGSKETIFQPGMVLTCEPGIYIAEENFGIRLENDILIGNEEPIDLLADEPIEPDEIERLMAKK